MAGYTKGPWEVSAVDHSNGRGVIFWDVEVPRGDNAGYRGGAAMVSHSEGIDGITKDEAEANAHLIAAAPDMYEALKEALDFIAREYGDPESQAIEGEYISQDARPIWNKICSTIAKAKGAK